MKQYYHDCNSYRDHGGQFLTPVYSRHMCVLLSVQLYSPAKQKTKFFMKILRALYPNGRWSTILYIGCNFCDFLFAFQHSRPHLKRGQLHSLILALFVHICNLGPFYILQPRHLLARKRKWDLLRENQNSSQNPPGCTACPQYAQELLNSGKNYRTAVECTGQTAQTMTLHGKLVRISALNTI